jgi:hypothetical protein
MSTFTEVFDALPDGWLSQREAYLLWKNASGKILEVGSYHGRSTVLLAYRGRVTAIDSFSEDKTTPEVSRKDLEIFLANIAGLPVKHLLMRIEDWEPTKMNFVFLDGDHTEEGTTTQLKKAIACGPKSIAIHDFNNKEVRASCLSIFGREPDVVVEKMALYRL